MRFGVYAAEWLDSHNVELTTRARDLSLLRTHLLKAAIRDRLIAINAAAGVRLPKKRQQAGDRQTISREAFTEQLLPAIPPVIGLWSHWLAEPGFAGESASDSVGNLSTSVPALCE